MVYATLSRYTVFSNQSNKMVIPGWWVVEYSLQWYVEVNIMGEIICLVHNNGYHESFTIGLGKDK